MTEIIPNFPHPTIVPHLFRVADDGLDFRVEKSIKLWVSVFGVAVLSVVLNELVPRAGCDSVAGVRAAGNERDEDAVFDGLGVAVGVDGFAEELVK